jgi:hypothetical protein
MPVIYILTGYIISYATKLLIQFHCLQNMYPQLLPLAVPVPPNPGAGGIYDGYMQGLPTYGLLPAPY